MSNAVLPSLIGLNAEVIRTPTWTTNVQRTVAGVEIRGSYQLYPIYEFQLGYEVLKDGNLGTDLAALTGFYLARQGSYDNWLYSDPQDNSVTAATFGTGDGATTAFQLIRAYGAGGFTYTEPVQNLNSAPAIYVNGVLKTLTTDYTVSSSGLVTFTVAPAAAAALTWTGTFYYRCRFLDDQLPFNRMMNGLWAAKALKFRGAPGNFV